MKSTTHGIALWGCLSATRCVVGITLLLHAYLQFGGAPSYVSLLPTIAIEVGNVDSTPRYFFWKCSHFSPLRLKRHGTSYSCCNMGRWNVAITYTTTMRIADVDRFFSTTQTTAASWVATIDFICCACIPGLTKGKAWVMGWHKSTHAMKNRIMGNQDNGPKAMYWLIQTTTLRHDSIKEDNQIMKYGPKIPIENGAGKLGYRSIVEHASYDLSYSIELTCSSTQ